MDPVFIIAEAGVNHNGQYDKALQLIDVAVDAGADAVKFQTFKAENLVTACAQKAQYQKRTTTPTEPQLQMLKRLELGFAKQYDLKRYCEKKGIHFLSTAFDFESLRFLITDLGLKTLKIPSGEITNGPLLLAYAKAGCKLILSTGMASIGEIDQALAVLSFGLLTPQDHGAVPSKEAFLKSFQSPEGQRVLNEKLTLLHCTTEYPAPVHDVNLSAMTTMRQVYGLPTGYSDHTEGITVPIAAAALGAVVIEKHFTLDKTLPGPDHGASLEPQELKAMVRAVRTVENAMGNGIKIPSPSEMDNRLVARKSLVASRKIEAGEKFSTENLTMKRPGTGISPMHFWEFLGQTAEKTIQKGSLV